MARSAANHFLRRVDRLVARLTRGAEVGGERLFFASAQRLHERLEHVPPDYSGPSAREALAPTWPAAPDGDTSASMVQRAVFLEMGAFTSGVNFSHLEGLADFFLLRFMPDRWWLDGELEWAVMPELTERESADDADLYGELSSTYAPMMGRRSRHR